MIPPREISENGAFPALARKINELIRYAISLTPRPSINVEVDHLTTGTLVRPKASKQQPAETDDLTWL